MGSPLSESDEDHPNYSTSETKSPPSRLKKQNEKLKDIIVALPSVSTAKKRAIGEGTSKRHIPVDDDDWKSKYFELLKKYNDVRDTCHNLCGFVYQHDLKTPSFNIPEVEEKKEATLTGSKEKTGSSVKSVNSDGSRTYNWHRGARTTRLIVIGLSKHSARYLQQAGSAMKLPKRDPFQSRWIN